MPFRNGAIAYSRFVISGNAPDAPDDRLFATLRDNLISTRTLGDAEVSSGFCTGRHVFDAEFTYEHCGFGASLLAAMRLDAAAVPGEIKRAYRAIAEDARRGKNDGVPGLSRGERTEAREEAEARWRKELADGKYRRVSMVPFLWDLPSAALLAPLTSDKQVQEMKSLLEVAFDVRLEPRSAGSVARDVLGAMGKTSALDDALPDALVDRPEGPGRDLDDEGTSADFRRAGRPEVPWAQAAGEPSDFLGNLFLLWLWWQCDVNEGTIETNGPTVALAVERTLDMECAWGVTGGQTLRGDAPTRMPEARRGLQQGKWPRKLGLMLAAHGAEFRCVLQGDRFAVSGLVLPALENEKTLAPRQVLEQRLDQVLTFDRVLVAMYEGFLKERFGSSWETRAGQLREWIARGGKRTRERRATSAVEVKHEDAVVAN